MNINSYIKRVSNFTYKELAFNEVDFLIFSELAYIDLQLVVPQLGNNKKKFIKLKDISEERIDEINHRSVDDKYNKVMLKSMMKSKRYQDILVGYAYEIFSKELANQFAAFTLILPNKVAFITFRGTDISLAGWKEDLIGTYLSETLAQKEARSYTNHVLGEIDNKFYLGGHSKGGNLAMFSALNLIKKDYEDRLISALSFDGPGFKDDVSETPVFQRMESKLEKYLTNRDVIGVMFNQIKNPKIVKSTGLLFGGHDPFFWQVSKNNVGQFLHIKKRTNSSIIGQKTFELWIPRIPDSDKMLAVEALFDIFKDDTIYQLFSNAPKSIINYKKSLKLLKR